LATRNLVDICQKTKKKLLYISTDFVFDGKKDHFLENDQPNPLNWYGKTKYEGEIAVSNLNENGLVIRISYPYRMPWAGKPDFVSAIINKLKKSEVIYAPYDQIFVPTFIDDIGYSIKHLIESHAYGIFHITGSQYVNSYDAANMIAEIFGYNKNLIQKTTCSEYYRNKAIRPLRTILANVKITKYGIKMNSFNQGLHIIKSNLKGVNL
jgi:dTDP-4-dehydrorhamnose reductase